MKKIFKQYKKYIYLFLVFLAVNLITVNLLPKDTTPIIVTINSGDSISSVLDNLVEEGIISNKKSLNSMFIKENGNIYPNQYELNKSMSTKEIFDILNNPTSNVKFDSKNKLVIIEGDNVESVATKIEKVSESKFSKNDIINYWNDKQVLKELIDKHWFLTDEILNNELLYSLEGYLAPATYNIDYNSATLESITNTILSATNNQLQPYKNKKFINNYTLHQILSLASIIERETIKSEDKYKVSGVFYNRIDQGIKLQSDITVLYAMQQHKELVTFKDLEYNSPFNTYIVEGLPPGPIASPQKTSIDAAINPDKNDYLYFFATQDTGEVIYTKTYEDHLKVAEENAWK